ncbi:nucleoside triphosphate pyrophosphohydrolase family protein [Mucilaginibacter flavidus]|uniref:nucleoside triphosphate pyrophosphohydrolase family protein n=1 Tax=Mucilaginibacter flavidus TaxID=2949309 RepID=UPI002093B0FB|nr:nucleoside triphosphate pyrophosphohydrolase family protein [Mucilaginibacter flavidus]MCO5950865.1 nucleoside triphosphate pyrophosphohydrolase family protein [Mucilaginibacter flavidus]
MEFSKYQQEAIKTRQPYPKEHDIIVPFLGIVGETGSVISELKKKIRDGESYLSFKKNLTIELGDVLWYIANIASQNELSLEDIAAINLEKIQDRWINEGDDHFIIIDEGYPEEERFEPEFEITFKEYSEKGKTKVEILKSGVRIGDPITDNSYENDQYRYHDIFHFGYIAYLGWSPVIRKLLSNKRKSKDVIDEVEDGARSAITEELITLLIFTHSQNHDLFKYTERVDTEILDLVQKLVADIEVKVIRKKQWEIAILGSYKVFHELVKNKGGRVNVSLKNRKLTYMGKN